ncbi:hypothetical protein EJB05_23383, partial [Eragrostis curvula]
MSPNTVVRVWESLDAFQVARKAYERVLAPTPSQAQEEVAKNAICLLLWMETIVGVKVLQDVLAMESDSTTLSQVIQEADAVHSYVVRGHDDLTPEHLEGIPAITALCGGGRLVDSRFFEFHRDLVAHGVGVIQDNVAPLLFNDRLHVMLLRYENEVRLSVNPRRAPALLEPFVARTRTPPEDSRAAFVSFPDSPPTSPERILGYFERVLGFKHHIERIVMEQPREGQVPKHGIIVFKSAELREEAMMNETPIFFRINGHDMWVQLYQPLF